MAKASDVDLSDLLEVGCAGTSKPNSNSVSPLNLLRRPSLGDVTQRGATNAFEPMGEVAYNDELLSRIKSGVGVYFNSSGGKDSLALALAGTRWLDKIGHQGPRKIVHAHLGRVEWQDSIPACERLAKHLGIDLEIVSGSQGDLMDRWLARWAGIVHRWTKLERLALMTPWSTPSLRFCTSEMKSNPLKRNAREQTALGGAFVSAVGLRREESTERAKKPIWQQQYVNTQSGITGWLWSGILHWSEAEVFAEIGRSGIRPHEGYTHHNLTRVSCMFCIMQSLPDMRSASLQPQAHALFREIVALECRSTFSFHGSRWLADVAPDLLSSQEIEAVKAAKVVAAERSSLQDTIPDEIKYKKNQAWPSVAISSQQARVLAATRSRIASIMGIQADYTDGESLQRRWNSLMLSAGHRSATEQQFDGSVAEFDFV